MKRMCLILLIAMLISLSTRAADRFLVMDLYIDPNGQSLAAYQVEITAPAGTKIVGVEGGEHPEFRKAPYYDPKAIQRERLIAAAFSTARAGQLPTASTRVLTLHLQTDQFQTPQLKTILKITADPAGQQITGTEIRLIERKAQ